MNGFLFNRTILRQQHVYSWNTVQFMYSFFMVLKSLDKIVMNIYFKIIAEAQVDNDTIELTF